MREFVARAQAAVDPTTGGGGGRLPLGPMAGWEVSPFERAGLQPRPLVDFADPEPDRRKAPGRTYAALRALEGVGNVHINKWENGTGHLSVTLLARPLGVLQLRGSNLPVWADMLPPTPPEELTARSEVVRAALA